MYKMYTIGTVALSLYIATIAKLNSFTELACVVASWKCAFIYRYASSSRY